MAAGKSITVGPTYLGLVKTEPFQRSYPESVVDARDFWPKDKTGRARLATRPGYANFLNGVAAITNCNLIHSLDVAADENNASPPTYKRQLMIAYEGELYKNTGVSTTWTQVGANNVIDTGRNVEAASYANTLYIANVTNEYKRYRFMDDTVTAFTGSSGPGGPAAPQKCPHICTWGARLVLAGRDKGPHVVHFSRVDDPDDWDLSVDDIRDIGKAVSVPNINAPITALVPHNSDCLLACTLTSTWIFSGNPNVGTLRQLSAVSGAISGKAWCRDPYGRIYMLTRRGLEKMEGPCGAPLVPVSTRKIPESLIGLDGVTDVAYLEYDTKFDCIHIYVEGTSVQRFHYFPETDSFWPVSSPGDTIRAIGRYDLMDTTNASGVLIGTAAQLKRLDRATAVSAAYVDILVPHEKLGDKGMVGHMAMKLGSNSDDNSGTITYYGAKSAEAVAARPAGRKAATTVAAMIANHGNWCPRVAGNYGLLSIVQSSAHISFEEAVLSESPAGRERGA